MAQRLLCVEEVDQLVVQLEELDAREVGNLAEIGAEDFNQKR